jgi:hypothetical protein
MTGPIDGEDLTELDPLTRSVLSGVSDSFAAARRLTAAVASEDSAMMAEIVAEIDSQPGAGLVALAAATEAVRAMQADAIPADKLVPLLIERAFRQAELADRNRSHE